MGDEQSIAETTARQFADEKNLVKRQALFDFADPTRSRGGDPLDGVAWSGRQRVLDAGCGNGIWTARLLRDGLAKSVCGCDISAGMIRAATDNAPRAAFVQADLARLPFADSTFDVVLCLWVLHLVSDLAAVLQEIRRVLRPRGAFLAVTNSAIPSPHDVLRQALSRVLGRPVENYLPEMSFNAETGGTVLGTVFAHVERTERVAAFAVPTPGPILASVESVREPVEVTLGVHVDWESVEAEARRLVEDAIAKEGVFRREVTGASFVCSP